MASETEFSKTRFRNGILFMSRSKSILLKKDPLVIAGVGLLVLGIFLTLYGFIPFERANYNPVAQGSVPISGAFNTTPESYFLAHYNGTGTIDKVSCYPSNTGWICYGFQFIGSITFFSYSSRYYGLGMIVLGALSVYAGNRLSPLKQKPKHTRPITIRIDEGICLSNGVCTELAPKVFQFKKQESPTIFAPLPFVLDPNGADNDTIIEAAQMCPTGAIVIEDAVTGDRIHPQYPKN